MFENNPLFFINFLFFSSYNFCFWKAVFCWKHYKNSVFRKTHIFKNTVSKTHFFTHVKKQLFPKKRCHFWFLANIRWNPYFYSFSCFTLFWSKKKFWPKQIVCTKMRVFSPFLTQIVSGNFCKKKILFSDFSYFWITTLKKPYFYRVFFAFSLFFFLPFLFLYLQHKKGKNKKCNFLFENLIFDIPKILQKHYFDTLLHYLSF